MRLPIQLLGRLVVHKFSYIYIIFIFFSVNSLAIESINNKFDSPQNSSTRSTLESTNDVVTSFNSGKIRLNVDDCGWGYGKIRSSLKKLHANSQWTSLASLLGESGCNRDLEYFYLGQSAEYSGHMNAAIIYYQLAKSSKRKCDLLFNLCEGFVFPRDIEQRISTINLKNYKLIESDNNVSKNNLRYHPKELSFGNTVAFENLDGDLPENFLGTNIKTLLSFINNKRLELGIDKDEFTTTADHHDTLRVLTKTLNENGKLIFVLNHKPNSTNELDIKYNADRSEFVLSVKSASFPNKNYRNLYIITSVSDTIANPDMPDMYEASNAYGKKITVFRSEKNAYGFIPYNLNSYRNFNYQFRIPMGVDDARNNKFDLAIAFVSQAMSPLFLENTEHINPKTDSPIEQKIYTKGLMVNVEEVIIYKQSSGKILQRLTIKP